jgi:hypothetical protein
LQRNILKYIIQALVVLEVGLTVIGVDVIGAVDVVVLEVGPTVV